MPSKLKLHTQPNCTERLHNVQQYDISERTISTFPTVDVCQSLWAGSSKDLVEMVLRRAWLWLGHSSEKRPKETENRTGPHSEKGPGPGPGLLYPSFPI